MAECRTVQEKFGQGLGRIMHIPKKNGVCQVGMGWTPVPAASLQA